MKYVGNRTLDCCPEVMVWPDLFGVSSAEHPEVPSLQHVRVFDLVDLPETKRAVRMVIEVDDACRTRQLHPDLFRSIRYLVPPDGTLDSHDGCLPQSESNSGPSI